MSVEIKCPVCAGEGKALCAVCSGEGYRKDKSVKADKEPCAVCKGSGYIICNGCKGLKTIHIE